MRQAISPELLVAGPSVPVVNWRLAIKDSGPEEHADYETDARPSSTMVVDVDEP